PLYQRRFAVLDPAADWEAAVAAPGRVSRGLEYVSAFFSEPAAYWVPLCPRVKQMAQPAVASGSARNRDNLDCDLSFPVSGSLTGNLRTTGESNCIAA